MKPLIALIALLTFSAYSADVVVVWVNDATNPSITQTVVSYGGAPGVYTNSITVAAGVSTVTITNFPPGRRIYVAARHTDGVDFSIYSNEDNAKTKLNPPKNLAVTP